MTPTMDHVLHICTRYLRGGSEARIRDMMNALPEVDHHLILGAESDADLARRQLPARKVSVEPLLSRTISPHRDLACLLRLRSVIKETQPTVTVTHQSKAGVLGRLAAWSRGVPVVHSLSMASFGPGYSRLQDLIFRAVELALSPITTGYLVVGEDLVDRFAGIGIPREKFSVVRSGVRLSGTDADRPTLRARLGDRWGVSVEIPWLVYVGSLERRKNVTVLPRLMNQIREVAGEEAAHLFIAGEGPLRSEIESARDADDLTGSITLTGYVEDAIDYIHAADVVVLLSSAEGMPQTLVQAAAVGTPFVAFDVDGIQELLRAGASGSTTKPGDLTMFVDDVLRYLRCGHRGQGIDTAPWSAEIVEQGYSEFFRDLRNIIK